MTTKEIAMRHAEYCRKAEWEKAQKELYADNAVSIEPVETEYFAKETRGLKEIIEKGKKFDSTVEKIHSVDISEPLIVANSFVFTMTMDSTMKEGGERWAMSELCLYEVKDGKVVTERFFV